MDGEGNKQRALLRALRRSADPACGAGKGGELRAELIVFTRFTPVPVRPC